jgi:ABC-type dipeptide/oligopeptide/nickel transport system permease component
MFVSFAARRLLQCIPVFLGVTFLSFLLIRAAPGDAAHFFLAERGIDLSADALAKTRKELGLDAPIARQYAAYLKAVLSGNFGVSYITKEPVARELTRRFRVSLLLALTSLTASLFIALALGALSALWQNSAFDKAVRFFSLLGLSLPAFCLALLLIMIFGVKLRALSVFSASGSARYILPCITLITASAAYYTRFIRAVLLEEFSKEYIRTAKACGLPLFAVVRSCLKNISFPVLTSLGMSLAALLAGHIVVEKIFALPGIGSYLIDGLIKRDYAAVDGCVLLYAALFSLLNLSADIACAYIHPHYEK